MGKKIKFPLILKNNQPVRTMEELREHIDVEKLYENFLNGKLVVWLQDRYYTREAKLIQEIDKEDLELLQKLFDILGIEITEDMNGSQRDLKSMEQHYRKLNVLKQLVDDEMILSNVERVAFDQVELDNIIKSGCETIYLFNNSFSVSADAPVNTLIGIGDKVSLTVDDLETLRKKKIDIQNISVYSQGKIMPLKEEKVEYEYFLETCYEYDEGANKVSSLEDGTLYTTRYDGLFQRNKETGDKKIISKKNLDVREFVYFETGICYRTVGARGYIDSKVFYFDLKNKNVEIWKGSCTSELLNIPKAIGYESNYVSWYASERVRYFFNTSDSNLQKLDNTRDIRATEGRVLLQDNYIYSKEGSIYRFDIKVGKIHRIEMNKPRSFRIYEDMLYIESDDGNFYKVSPITWKPLILSNLGRDTNNSVLSYFAHENEFVWMLNYRGEITIRILDMQRHKIVNTIKYTCYVNDITKFKLQGEFIYISSSSGNQVEVKKVNKLTGTVENISKEVFEEVTDVLIDDNLLRYGIGKAGGSNSVLDTVSMMAQYINALPRVWK